MDVFLLGIILRTLGIIQVQNINFTDHKGLEIGSIPLTGYFICALGNPELFLLIAETLDQNEQFLIEVERLLPQAALRNPSVALGHLHLAASLAPIDKWNRQPYLNQLVAA